MNNRGQTLGLTILSCLFILLTGLVLLNFLMPEITNFRANMSCSDASNISDGVKVLCIITDGLVPYWIVLVFSLIVGAIGARLAF